MVRTSAHLGERLQLIRYILTGQEEYTLLLFRGGDLRDVSLEVDYYWRSEAYAGSQWMDILRTHFVFVAPPPPGYRRQPGDSPEPVRYGCLSKLLLRIMR